MNQDTKISIRTVVVCILIGFIVCVLFLYERNKKENNQADQNQPASAQDSHVSMYYYDNLDFFDESVKTFKDTQPLSPQPRIFIVNQHILAAHLIAQQFALAADPKVKTVVLVTQNNWNVGRSPIITSKYGWKTPLGNIPPATKVAETLVSKKLAAVDEDIFNTEHGITGIVPYVAHSFPNASVVPIVIRDGTADVAVDALAAEISKLDLSTTVIIGTIDMSHYLPKYIADAHDRMTLQSIQEFDYESLPRLDIDTVPTLRTILKVAETADLKKFVQTGGINSAEIVNDPDLLITTSYITGYFAPTTAATATVPTPHTTASMPAQTSKKAVHMLFVGDIMLDRSVAKHARKFGQDSLFANLERLFLGTHIVTGNLEGTITNNQSLSETNNSVLRFTFAPAYANLLKKLNFSAVSLANNHTFDFGREGYSQTVQNLRSANLAMFGSPRNDENLSTKIVAQGKMICFVGHHDLFVSDSAPAANEIKKIRPDCSYVILFAHWGSEYQSEPSERQKTLAYEFIDAGADLVIGAHPHVVQPMEIYKNKAIFYSLGNFLFDQELSFATEHGLAVNVEWSNEKTIFTLVPTVINDREVSIANPADAQRVITSVVGGAMSADILKTKQFILWNNL